MEKTVVIIDDEKSITELVTTILNQSKINVICFNNPKEALNEIKKNVKPDLILLDMRMPQLSGPEFCKLVREDEEIKDIKIIFFSASDDINASLLKKYNIEGFIQKPFDIHEFSKEVIHYLED